MTASGENGFFAVVDWYATAHTFLRSQVQNQQICKYQMIEAMTENTICMYNNNFLKKRVDDFWLS